MTGNAVVVSGAFDDIRAPAIRFLEEASRLGELTVLLWDDGAVQTLLGRAPRFPLAERRYVLGAVRYVAGVEPVGVADTDRLPDVAGLRPAVWADLEGPANEKRAAFCRARGIEYRVIPPDRLAGFPEAPAATPTAGRRKVVVTGSFDYFHSGHVRFFEEVSQYGDLYAIVGHDANIRLLKGEGHPMVPQAERRYLVGAINYVRQALVSSGTGWLDGDPEIRRLKPDIYAVNEDGDTGGKREYCAEHGIEYLVLTRAPAAGLPRRSSTELRGF